MSFTSRAFLAATLLGVPTILWAAPGALDTTFNGTGTVLTAISPQSDFANAAAIQPDGKVVSAGMSNNGTNNDFALARYNADGSLDASFGTGGTVTTAIGNGNDSAFAMTLQPDGKVVAAGSSVQGADTHFAIARYNSDGSLDTSFGTGGIVTTPVGNIGEAYAIALQPDGKTVIAGFTYDGAIYKFALLRYNTDGSLDTGFGSGGVVTTAIGTIDDEINALALQPDGKVVAVGSSKSAPFTKNFALARYNADGSLDSGFGNGGIVTTAVGGGSAYIAAAALQPDGKVVVAGAGDGSYFAARYNADGSLDTQFTSGAGYASAVALQPDGRVLAAGSELVRYNTDGSLDTSFNSGGTVSIAFVATALALQPDGKAVAVGSNGSDFALTRYIASDTPWDVTPDAIVFTDQSNVASGSAQTSNTITVAGLDTGAAVPLHVSGGSYSLNGGAYSDALGWVRNGDTVTVQQTAASVPSSAMTTTLTVGGLVATNNPNVRLGNTVSATFTSTTASGSSGGGGGGVLGLASLLLLGLVGARRRRSSASA